MNELNPPNRVSLMVCLLMAALSCYFFATNVAAHFFVSDDAYISFRYASNLVEGYGLVWNPEEAVEGYTNFLWVLFMAISLYLNIPPEITSTTISVLAAILVLALFVRSFALLHGLNNPWTWLPVLIMSLSASFTGWATSGLETMFFTLLVFSGFLQFMRERQANSALPVYSSTLFALATLTRPDGGVFMIAAGLFFLTDILLGKRSLRNGLVWAAPYLVIVGAHLLWRYSYYGFWLPNTFYAKVAGTGASNGVNYLSLFGVSYQIYWFLPLLLVPLWLRRNYTTALFAGILLTYLVYLLYVGGDIFEFRFMVVVFPYLYWLLGDGLALLFSANLSKPPLRYAAMTLALLAGGGLLWTTYQGSVRPIPYKYRAGNNTLENIRAYADQRAEQGRFIRSLIDQQRISDDFVTGMGGSGAVPYFTRLETVDRRGLNDVYVARLPVAKQGRMGHERNAPNAYLTERKVAVFDLFNKLVFSEDDMIERKAYAYDGQAIAVKAVKVDGRYLVFGTFVSDDELEKIFGDLPIETMSVDSGPG